MGIQITEMIHYPASHKVGPEVDAISLGRVPVPREQFSSPVNTPQIIVLRSAGNQTEMLSCYLMCTALSVVWHQVASIRTGQVPFLLHAEAPVWPLHFTGQRVPPVFYMATHRNTSKGVFSKLVPQGHCFTTVVPFFLWVWLHPW